MAARKFKPGLVPTIVVILLFPILVRLGFWQLERAEEKQAIQELFDQRAQLEPMWLGGELADITQLKYRRVVAKGRFDADHQILLDNKVYNQAVGYHVLTPFKIAGTNKVVLVNRGWIHGGLDRRVLPRFDTPVGLQQINGVISIPSSKVFTLSDYNRDGKGWPAVYQWIDFKDMTQATGLQLLPVIILQAPQDADGFVRKWTKANLQPEKNISYAVQWFTMALALLVIYIVVNLRKVETTPNE